jgi:negative regulator of flagellin synthesis FlgM
MKIFGSDPNFKQAKVNDVKKQDQAAAPVRSAKAETAPQADTAKGAETVAVSSFARDVAKAGTVVRNTPDIRKEKVSAIKEKIDKGEYHVSGDKIAGKIMDDIVKQGAK